MISCHLPTRLSTHCVLSLLTLGLLMAPAAAQDKAPTAAKDTAKKTVKTRQPNPALAPIADIPGLPRVLLIGDSISMGYTVPTREMLKGKANVHRIPTNGGPSSRGVASIKTWLGDSKWDVIHFNFGLHDMVWFTAEGKRGAKPNDPGAHYQVSLADYEANLKKIVSVLKTTGAKLIWCNTTPVPPGSASRQADDSLKFNEVAARVMTAAGIPTNDLHSHAQAKLKTAQLPANVHFTDAGSRYLAEKVAAEIIKALPKS